MASDNSPSDQAIHPDILKRYEIECDESMFANNYRDERKARFEAVRRCCLIYVDNGCDWGIFHKRTAIIVCMLDNDIAKAGIPKDPYRLEEFVNSFQGESYVRSYGTPDWDKRVRYIEAFWFGKPTPEHHAESSSTPTYPKPYINQDGTGKDRQESNYGADQSEEGSRLLPGISSTQAVFSRTEATSVESLEDDRQYQGTKRPRQVFDEILGGETPGGTNRDAKRTREGEVSSQ